jgi:hypothetical protein
VVAWSRSAPGGSVVETARKAPGGGFAEPVALTTAAEMGTTPSVGIDAQGNATIAWAQAGGVVRATRWPAGGGPEPAQTLSGGPCTGADNPVIGVGANGTALVAFEAAAGGPRVLCAAVRSAASGPLADSAVISAPRDDFQGPTFSGPTTEVAVNSAGDAAVAWAADIDLAAATVRYAVEARFRPAGGPFSAFVESPESVPAPQEQVDPALAIAPDGRVTMAWTFDSDRNVGTNPLAVRYADRPAGGSLSSGTTANLPGEQAAFPDLAAAGDGTVIGAWSAGAGADLRVQAAVRPPGGAFGSHANLSAPGMSFTVPEVAANAAGHAIIAWGGNMADGIFTVRRTPDGQYGGVVAAADRASQPPGEQFNFFNPALALDDQGNASAVWLFDHFRGGTDHWRVQTAGFDAAPPALTSSVPPGGALASPIGMAATATDRLTPVTINWSFGDGASAAGGAVSHAFGAAGAFTVTVTATDGVGNATSAAHPVLIAAGDPPKKKRIRSKVKINWGVTSSRTFLIKLKVRKVPKRGKAQVTCKPKKKCPFKKVSSKKRRKGTITLFKNVKLSKVQTLKRRTFRPPGQRVELRITAPGYIGKVVRYKLKRDKVPVGKERCLPVGSKKPRKRCN